RCIFKARHTEPSSSSTITIVWLLPDIEETRNRLVYGFALARFVSAPARDSVPYNRPYARCSCESKYSGGAVVRPWYQGRIAVRRLYGTKVPYFGGWASN